VGRQGQPREPESTRAVLVHGAAGNNRQEQNEKRPKRRDWSRKRRRVLVIGDASCRSLDITGRRATVVVAGRWCQVAAGSKSLPSLGLCCRPSPIHFHGCLGQIYFRFVLTESESCGELQTKAIGLCVCHEETWQLEGSGEIEPFSIHTFHHPHVHWASTGTTHWLLAGCHPSRPGHPLAPSLCASPPAALAAHPAQLTLNPCRSLLKGHSTPLCTHILGRLTHNLHYDPRLLAARCHQEHRDFVQTS